LTELTEEEMLARLKTFRNKSMQKLCFLYWKFGHRYYSKDDVMNFIRTEIGVNDSSVCYGYYNAFRLLAFISNRRRQADVIAAKKRVK